MVKIVFVLYLIVCIVYDVLDVSVFAFFGSVVSSFFNRFVSNVIVFIFVIVNLFFCIVCMILLMWYMFLFDIKVNDFLCFVFIVVVVRSFAYSRTVNRFD